MKKVIVTTDSGMNPTNKEYMVPGLILSKEDNKNYYDTVKGVDSNIDFISPSNLFQLRKEGKRFTTSASTSNDYKTLFVELLEKGYDVLHLSMSSGISSASCNISYNLINTLSEEYDNKIYFIDSITAGSGGTILYKYAEDLVNKGYDIDYIKEEIEKIKYKILSSYYISIMSGYRESGRVPYGTKLLDMLSIRYRIDINDNGELYPKKIYRGRIDKTITKYIEDIINENTIELYNPNYLSLLNMPLNKIDKNKILEYIKSFNYFNNIIEEEFYGTITAYGVEDQIGIGLIKK